MFDLEEAEVLQQLESEAFSDSAGSWAVANIPSQEVDDTILVPSDGTGADESSEVLKEDEEGHVGPLPQVSHAPAVLMGKRHEDTSKTASTEL